MTIKDWKKVFKKKLKPQKDCVNEGDCFESSQVPMDMQLSRIKKLGEYKVFYFKLERNSNLAKALNVEDTLFISFVSEAIHVDEPQYL